MDRGQIIATLRNSEAALRERGVSHAALFGSRARGEQHRDSDIDILVEFDATAHLGLWGYVALRDYIAGMFADPVDVVSREGLKPHVRPSVVAEALYAF